MATANFHESCSPAPVKPPSERSTGLVLAAAGALLAYAWRDSGAVLYSLAAIAAGLAILAVLAPHLLRPVNFLWFQFSLALHRVVNPLVMLAIFALIFTPAGALMRLWRDPLRKRRAPDAKSYWIELDEPLAGSMKNQF
jgi:hypothetical protein